MKPYVMVNTMLTQVRDMEPGSAVWIAKPSITNQGIGIAVIDSCAGLRSALESQPDLREWVVQVGPQACTSPCLSYYRIKAIACVNTHIRTQSGISESIRIGYKCINRVCGT